MRAGILPALEIRVGGILEVLSRWFAYFGGLILVAIALMVVGSIFGRALIPVGLSSVPGDVELTEVGTAIAVFCFLPWCQMRGGHVTVDVITDNLPRFWRGLLILFGQIVLAFAAGLLLWRHFDGFLEKTQYGETTFILAIPIWWGFGVALLGAGLFAVASVFTVWRSYNDWRSLSAPTPIAGGYS